jgi:hypothetical protein
MFRFVPALALSCGLALAAPALAQDTREARLAVAQTYIDATLADMDMPALIRTMYQPILDQIASSGTRLTQGQIDRIDALYQQEMGPPMLNIMQQQAGIMADLFTLEEIETLARFYNTPVGRSVMQKLPQLVQAQQPAILAMVQNAMPRLIPQIQAILAQP